MEIDYIYQHSNYVTNGVTNVYSTHLIVEEDKPDGRVLQNIYDSQRRVTNQFSTAGVDLNPVTTATFAYTNNFSLTSPTNLLTGVTAISDYFNHTTTYYYTNSLVQLIVDPLNQTIVQNWYQTNTAGGFQRSLQSITDKRGLQTAYLYDAYGNVTNTVTTGDLTGNGIPTQTATNTASYNANNLPVQITDPVGNSMVVVYDPTFTFQPQQVIRYAGTTPVSTNYQIYASVTNVVVDGSVTQTNTAFGVLTRRIRAYGSSYAATNDLFCNGQGFPTNSVQYPGTGDPNVVNQLFYDERGELVQRTDAVGANYLFDYDPMGRPTAQETFDTGQTTPMDWKFLYYDANGEINWIDGPRYNPEDYIFYDYDGDGRPTTEIHWRSEANSSGTGVEAPAGNNLYAQIFNQFDPLGNLVSKIDPRGAVTTNSWDALCRLVQTTRLDTDGATVLSTDGFSYEPGGQVQSHTNALAESPPPSIPPPASLSSAATPTARPMDGFIIWTGASTVKFRATARIGRRPMMMSISSPRAFSILRRACRRPPTRFNWIAVATSSKRWMRAATCSPPRLTASTAPKSRQARPSSPWFKNHRFQRGHILMLLMCSSR